MNCRFFNGSSGNGIRGPLLGGERTGVTEIRGPYYSPMGPNYLDDVLSTMGHYVDSLKFAGGAFSLMPEEEVQALLNLAHDHDGMVSTGGFMEYVLSQGRTQCTTTSTSVPGSASTSSRSLRASSPYLQTTGCASSRPCRTRV
jgi:hypothetical protein